MMLKKAATALMLAATILGCANLRIDVDVYKGPLANDEEVQIEQMAAMAIGAKPLLFTLRDRLECEARNQYTQCTDCVGVVPPFTELRREYMKERPNHLIFRSDLARQVNGILYLYSNKSKFDDTPATVKLQLEKLEAENNEFEALARSGNATYQAVQSKADDVYFAVLDTMLALRDPNLLNDPNNPMTQEAIDYAIWQGSRYIEFTLRSGGMQGLHSEEPSRPLGKAIASKLPDYQRENFLTSVNPTQRFPKYAQISDAIAQLIADDTGQALLQALRDDSQYYKDHYYDPESLGEKLQRTGRRPYITLFRAVGVPEDLNETPGVQSTAEGFVSSQNMAELKAQELQSSPSQPDRVTQEVVVEESTIPPHVVEPFMNALAVFWASIPGVSGLEGGRLNDGLETIIEAYLKAADGLQPSDVQEEIRPLNEERAKQQERLEDALAGFAKKVLVMVDNQQLLGDENHDIKEYTRVLQSVGNSILIQVNELVAQRKHRDGLKRAMPSEVVAIRTGLDQTALDVLNGIMNEFQNQEAAARKALAEVRSSLDLTQKALIRVNEELNGPDAKSGAAKVLKDAKAATSAAETALKTCQSGPGTTGADGKTIPPACAAEQVKLEEAKKAEADAQGKVDQLAAEQKELTTKRTALSSEVTDKQTRLANLEKANAAIQKVHIDVGGLNPKQVREKVRFALQELKSAATKPEDRVSFDLALDELASVNTPFMPHLADPQMADDAKEVFDQLIAAMEVNHIEMVREFGQDSENARSVEQAIKLAYDYRANQVFIRPPSFYLRSSYPVTALQDNPNLGWQNRLVRHMAKSIPLVGEAIVNGPRWEDMRIQTEIDKQFWQNINSVRVAGAGNQNYVLTQDDIGNWYTKGYSSNPEEIINAAQSSALFAIGGSMDVNLLDKLKRGDNATLYKADIAAGSHGSSFDNRTNDFIAQTAADKETVIAEMQKSGGLRSRIESRWATVLRGEDIAGKKLTFFQKDLLEQMDGAYDMFLKSALEQLDKGTSREEANDALFKAISKTDNRLAQAAAKLALKAQQENSGDPQLGLRIFSALDATVRFQSDLKARISMLDPVAKVEAELKKSGVTDEATIGAARDAAKALHNKILTDLDSVLQGEILGLIQQRKLVVDTFIAQMELLGDDLSPKAPASGS